MSLALALLAAHLLGDFPLQPDTMARQKLNTTSVRATHVAIHGALVVVLLLPLVSLRDAGLVAGVISVVHFLVDSRRWVDEDAGGFDGYPMAVDQTLHVTTLYVASLVIQI